MAKGDVTLVPVVLQATDPDDLAKKVVAERIKRNQLAAVAHYTAVSVRRRDDSSFTKYTAFIEFMVEEKEDKA